MKKILVLFGIITLLPVATMAYELEGETSSMKTLEAQGYSQSMMQAVDWTKYRSRGAGGTYVRYYQPKKGNWLGRAYQNAKEYVDPIQDSGNFGDGQVEFSNTWMGRETHYSSDYTKNKQIENL